MSSLIGHWHRWVAFLNQHLPDTARQLRPPVLPDVVAAWERRRGLTLPADVRTLYSLNDGETDEENNLAGGCFFGLYFLPFERMIITGDSEERAGTTSWPAGAVRAFDAHDRWFPIGHDGSGNFIGFDLDPGPTGTVGQIINFGRDETDKFVMAASLTGFMQLVLNQIGQGNYSLDVPDDNYPRLQIGDFYLTDSLRPLVTGS